MKISSFALSAVAMFFMTTTEVNANVGPKPTDAQIAAILLTTNTGEVDAGKVAQERAMNPEVKKFAGEMVRAHSDSAKQVQDLVTKLKMTAKPSDKTTMLKKDHDASMARLKALSGKEFDKAYVDEMVMGHQKVLDSIDKTLLPNASNTELKALLEKTRPVVAEHLTHAKHLQSTLK